MLTPNLTHIRAYYMSQQLCLIQLELKPILLHCYRFFLCMSFFIIVPRVSIDGEPHETLALLVCVLGFVFATIIIVIIAILLRKLNQIQMQKIQTLTQSQCDIEGPLEFVKKLPQTTASQSIEAATVSETKKNFRACEPIESHASESHKPKMRIFTIFESNKQCFDLN